MHNSDPLALLDNVGEDAQGGRNTLVTPTTSRNGVDVHWATTSLPCDVWGMDCVLDLFDMSDSDSTVAIKDQSTHVGSRIKTFRQFEVTNHPDTSTNRLK